MAYSEAYKSNFLGIGTTAFINYSLYFDDLDLTIDNENIKSESVSISQSICSDSTLRFGGCIATCFKVTVADINDYDIEGKKFNVFATISDASGNVLTSYDVGTYYVDTAKISSDKITRDIVAYDAFYTKGNTNVADWYENLFSDTDEVTLSDFICGLLDTIEIPYLNEISNVECEATIKHGVSMKGSEVTANTLLRMALELIGSFGYIEGNGYFTIINISESVNDSIDEYKDFSKSDYTLDTITGIRVQMSATDNGTLTGDDDNVYNITSNYLTYGMNVGEVRNLSLALINKFENYIFTPLKLTAYNTLYLSVGDVISILDEDGTILYTPILNRDISGIQASKDTLSSIVSQNYTVSEYSQANEVVTLKGKTLEITKTLDEVSSRMTDIENNTSSAIVQTGSKISMNVKNGDETASIELGQLDETGNLILNETAKNINLTADNIKIISKNFNVDEQGNVKIEGYDSNLLIRNEETTVKISSKPDDNIFDIYNTAIEKVNTTIDAFNESDTSLLNRICFYNGKYYSCNENKIYISNDGYTWNAFRTFEAEMKVIAVDFYNDNFIYLIFDTRYDDNKAHIYINSVEKYTMNNHYEETEDILASQFSNYTDCMEFKVLGDLIMYYNGCDALSIYKYHENTAILEKLQNIYLPYKIFQRFKFYYDTTGDTYIILRPDGYICAFNYDASANSLDFVEYDYWSSCPSNAVDIASCPNGYILITSDRKLYLYEGYSANSIARGMYEEVTTAPNLINFQFMAETNKSVLIFCGNIMDSYDIYETVDGSTFTSVYSEFDVITKSAYGTYNYSIYNNKIVTSFFRFDITPYHYVYSDNVSDIDRIFTIGKNKKALFSGELKFFDENLFEEGEESYISIYPKTVSEEASGIHYTDYYLRVSNNIHSTEYYCEMDYMGIEISKGDATTNLEYQGIYIRDEDNNIVSCFGTQYGSKVKSTQRNWFNPDPDINSWIQGGGYKLYYNVYKDNFGGLDIPFSSDDDMHLCLYTYNDDGNYSSIKLEQRTKSEGVPSSAFLLDGDGDTQFPKSVYSRGSVLTSDGKLKENVTELDEELSLNLINSIKPIEYNYIDSDKKRKHMGFVAQDTRDVCNTLKMGDMALYDAWVIDEEGNKVSKYVEGTDDEQLRWHISYTELIAPMVKTIQSLTKRVEELEKQLNDK